MSQAPHSAALINIMRQIAALSYLDMLEFADRIGGDADKIADATQAFRKSEQPPSGPVFRGPSTDDLKRLLGK